jgi:hypothetical protein
MVKLSDKIKFLSVLGLLFISLIVSYTPLSAQENYDPFLLPGGAGILLPGGSLSDTLEGSPLITEFLGTLQGDDGKILIVAFGFSSAEDAGFEIKNIAEHLPSISDSVVLTDALSQQPTLTPILATDSPEESQEKPTRTPKPTATPPTIPPSQNISQTNLMILFVVLAVIVVIIGVWLNRERR